jgi:hypothetical protein
VEFKGICFVADIEKKNKHSDRGLAFRPWLASELHDRSAPNPQ